ncbi:MAG: molybdopterin molybdotransferase MoeA [Planctomycetes bacterium]|nr:molybdopterin molybdotransferase MoeA [Planctomycetota bacterium]
MLGEAAAGDTRGQRAYYGFFLAPFGAGAAIMTADICDRSHKGHELLELEQALALLLQRAKSISSTAELLHLPDCLGRILAQEVLMDRDEPPVRRSAMDGYAVISGDGLAPRKLLGVVFAGTANIPSLLAGEAVAVMTGGTVPDGADAVIPVELTTVTGGMLQIQQPCIPGQHVRNAGEMGAAGRQLLGRGHRLQATDLAAVAGCGADPLQVYSLPTVAILSTGDEVVPWTQRPQPHQVRDSNRLATCLQAKSAGAEVVMEHHVLDQPEALLEAVQEARRQADLVITIGGVSMGSKDHLPDVFQAAGFEKLFHGVSVQPGKPVWAGQADDQTWALGLPGNPVSALVVFELLARPLLATLAGATPGTGPQLEAGIAGGAARAKARVRYILAAVQANEQGQAVVNPRQEAGSGDWTSLAGTRVLMKVPPHSEIAAGDAVKFLRL